MGTRPTWKRELQDIINRNNDRHAFKDKAVSFKTMHERAIFLFAFFRELRRNDDRSYKVQPSGLGNRHVTFMLSRWIQRDLSPATIRLNLSYLRVFARWIGKEGMITSATDYVVDASRVRRTYGAQSDRSWSSHGLDAADIVSKIAVADPFVGAQLGMCVAFGLRVKEAIMFRPFVSSNAGEVQLIRGTKGGRERRVPVDNDAKRSALELARRVAVDERGSLADPRRSLKQSCRRFYTVLEQFGITKRVRGVTAHGLRHQYGNDRYEQFAGAPSPVRGGPSLDRAVDRSARLRVAEELGHGRENITTAYMGAIVPSRSPAAGQARNDGLPLQPAGPRGSD